MSGFPNKRMWISLTIKLTGVIGAIAGLSACANQALFSSPVPIIETPSIAASMAEGTPFHYQVYTLPTSEVHTIEIPAGNQFLVIPAIAAETAHLEAFAQQTGAVAVLNGGFFDPQNQQSTSYVVQNQETVGDPTKNERLMQNPDLTPYLEKILDRAEFRRYQCGAQQRYDITSHSQPVPEGCQLVDALGAGPRLLPELTSEQEGFTATDASGAVIRDALGSTQLNARTAIGITSEGGILWVMAAQKPGLPYSGLSLPELAAFMQRQGVEKAMNLDGGSSSSLFYRGETIHGKIDSQGNRIQRPVKSVLLLKSHQNQASLPSR